MDLRNFPNGYIPTQSDFLKIQTNPQNSFQNLGTILGGGIPLRNLTPSRSQGDGSITISAGFAIDGVGRQMRNEEEFTVDFSEVTPPAADKEKWVTVVGRYQQETRSELQNDIGQPEWADKVETIEFVLFEGTEAPQGEAVKPALSNGDIIIVDCLIDDSDSQTAAIETVRRRELDIKSLESQKMDKAQNLDDLTGKAAARDNLDVYQKSEIDAKDDAKMDKAQNLDDLADKATARDNLDVYQKSEVNDLFGKFVYIRFPQGTYPKGHEKEGEPNPNQPAMPSPIEAGLPGTWDKYNYDGDFLRTNGGGASDFNLGSQSQGLPEISGKFQASFGNTYHTLYLFNDITGAFSSDTSSMSPGIRDGSHVGTTDRTRSYKVFFNASNPGASIYPNPYGAASEVRPNNRTIEIWIRTA